VEVQQCMELTDTNRPRACSYKGATRPLCSSRDTVGVLELVERTIEMAADISIEFR
jgi:hypothetical protein